jgi:hypothetical protein
MAQTPHATNKTRFCEFGKKILVNKTLTRPGFKTEVNRPKGLTAARFVCGIAFSD